MPSWVISLRPVSRHWRILAAVAIVAGLAGNHWAVAHPATNLPQASANAVIYQVPTDHKWVALTFDDGPSPQFTPQILRLLARYHAHATFFVIGQSVEAYPQLVRDEVLQGNEVGNHTWSHVNLAHQTAARIDEQLMKTQNAIRTATGHTPKLMRPPYGSWRKNLPNLVAPLGLRVVLWSPQGDTRDWSNPGADAIINQTMRSLKPGDIVLMHDGGGNRSQTVAALGVILKDLEARGFQAVTVHTLLQHRLPEPPSSAAFGGGLSPVALTRM